MSFIPREKNFIVIEPGSIHIKAEVGNSVLEDKLLNYATKIPEISGRGRAAIAGNDTIEYVNTPEIKQFPNPDLPIDQTLWGKIIL
jgi:hypothetical protein